MKIAFIALGLIIAGLLYPRYDLLVKEEFFTNDFTLEQAGFMTSVSCHQKAFDIKVKYYTCEPKAEWRRHFFKDEGDESNNSTNTSGLVLE